VQLGIGVEPAMAATEVEGRKDAAAVGSGGAAGHVEMATGAGFWFWAAELND